MTSAISPELLSAWNLYVAYLAYAVVAVGIIIILGHYLKLLTTTDHKKRYDYINMHEINLLWYGFLLIVIGATLYVNTLSNKTTWLWFFVWLFVSSMIAMIIGVVVQNLLKFYYPFFIEKRLKKLRFTPRKSPDGNLMKLLSEEEEDVYLDEGMQAEEDAFSVDYDVWIDEKTGYTKIEKYNGRMHALQCSECNYQTLRVEREEIIQPATETEEGELMKYLSCSYCGHKERKSFKIARVKESTSA
jgi:DNA-directed RNA polymerase subunit RPC12/RpoP